MEMSIFSMSANTFYDARQKVSAKEVSPVVVMDRIGERTITLIQSNQPGRGRRYKITRAACKKSYESYGDGLTDRGKGEYDLSCYLVLSE